MVIANQKKPVAFLSSMTWEFRGFDKDSSVSLRNLRRQAHAESDGRLYVAEVDDEPLRTFTHMEIMDHLLRRVQETSCFICLLGGRRRGRDEHGSIIEVANLQSEVSFFEAELFMAALLEKPIYVFVTNDFDPGPRLSSLLNLLGFALPRNEWRTGLTNSEIVKSMAEVTREYAKARFLPSWIIRKKVRRARCRAIAHKYREAIGDNKPHGSRPVYFLGGPITCNEDSPDCNLVIELLDQERKMDSSDARLGRLWLAIRELLTAPPDENCDRDILQLWNRTLGRWSNVSAWYGLHGHIDLGLAAATYTTARVRELMRSQKIAGLPKKQIEYPGGAIASALFSIAKWMPTRRERLDVLKDGLVHLHRSVDDNGEMNSGLCQMLGSYCVALGKISDGVEYFESALRLAEKEGINLGVSRSELGAAYLCQGRLIRGIGHLEAGAALLKDQSGGGTGEYARALRKLSVGYAVCGRPLSARRVRAELRDLIDRRGYFDQYR